MQQAHTIAALQFSLIPIERSSDVAQTMGDRISYLLRTHGRDIQNLPFEAAELLSWLNGEQPAMTTGKRYSIGTSKAALSRLMNDQLVNLPTDTIIAIADIFNVSLDWLVRGEESNGNDPHDIYITPEAGEIGQIADGLLEDSRKSILALCKTIARSETRLRVTHRELASTQKKLIDTMLLVMANVPTEQRKLIEESIALAERQTRNLPAT